MGLVMPQRIAIITVITGTYSDVLIRTIESVATQTLPCTHYLITIGGRSIALPGNAIQIDLPLASDQSLLAQGIGIQLAFNEGAAIAACLDPGELLEPRCLEVIASAFERTSADILELRNPEQSSVRLGTLFYSKCAAFVPGLWAQIHSVDARFLELITNEIIEMHGLSRVQLEMPLIKDGAKANRQSTFRSARLLTTMDSPAAVSAYRTFVWACSAYTSQKC